MPKDSQGRSGPKASLSCETCRRRKVRCTRPEATTPSGSMPPTDASLTPHTRQDLPTCSPCLAIGEECVTAYNRKRRGPLGSMSRSAISAEIASQSSTTERSFAEPSLFTHSTSPAGGFDNHISPFAFQRPIDTPSRQSVPIRQDPAALDNLWSSSVRSGEESTSDAHHGLDPGHIGHFGQWTQQQSSELDLGQSSPNSTHLQTDRRLLEQTHPGTSRFHQLSLEEVLPRDTAVYMISLYFDYVHALVPCVHRPTFLQKMHQHDDRINPGYYALLMSVLAATIVHVPKALLPFQDEAPIDIATRCMRASRAVSVKLYDPPSLTIITIRYFDSVFASLTGQPGAWAGALSEVRGLSIQLNLHRESSYAGLNPIETELRRRIFQTAFMADKSAACMQDQLIMLRTEDCDAQPPREIDDEYFAENAYMDQPDGTISKMAGHRVIAQTFEIIGELIIMRRATARSSRPCQAAIVLAQLRSLDSLNNRLVALFRGLPEPLQLEPPISSSPLSVMSATTRPWESQALSDLNTYLSSLISTTNDPPTSEAWRVMQGNCHVTRSIARLVLMDEILAGSGDIGSGQRAAAERVLSLSYQISDRRDLVISDLLYALRRIPMQPLSVNSRSIVNKIRFVAVTLLDSVLPTIDGSEAENTAATMNKDALLSFLNILSEIEQLGSAPKYLDRHYRRSIEAQSELPSPVILPPLMSNHGVGTYAHNAHQFEGLHIVD